MLISAGVTVDKYISIYKSYSVITSIGLSPAPILEISTPARDHLVK